MIVKDGKILLIERGVEPFRGFWALPGGYVEWDEAVEDAVKREVLEEIGLTVTSLKLIGVYSDPARHPKQAIDVAFAVEAKGDVKAGDDAEEYEWKLINKIPELAFDHNQIVADYLKNN